MIYKWMGSALVIGASGGFGVILAWNQIREERMLQQLAQILEYMESQLAYRLTPLPELCREASGLTSGTLGQVFENLSSSLESQSFPEVSGCMQAILNEAPQLPPQTRQMLLSLGTTLGRLDLAGQRKELLTLRGECRRNLQSLRRNRSERLRSIRTLGFCAGAALSILLI